MQKGFTLLEIIVVIGIVLLVTGTSFVSYNSFTRDKELEAEARKIGDVLELARKKSSAADLSTACTVGSLSGFKVRIDSDTTYSLVQEGCTNVVSPIATYTIKPPNITITSLAGAVLFKTLSAGASIGLGNPIRIKSSSSEKCIDTTISPTGTVSMSGLFSC